MFAPKYIAVVVFVFILLALAGGIMEGTVLGSNETTTLDGLMSWQRVFQENNFGITEIPGVLASFFPSLFKALLMDFAFFEGPWELAKMLLWSPIGAVIVAGIIFWAMTTFKR